MSEQYAISRESERRCDRYLGGEGGTSTTDDTTLLWPGRACQRGNGFPARRGADERGESLSPRFFLLRADDPPDGSPSIPVCLGLKEGPRGLIGAKLLLMSLTQTGSLSLLIRIDP